jgi:hypothetical protein
MSGGWIIEFKKVFIRCLILGCKRKHYAKGYCEKHYHQYCRSKYCHTWNEHLNFRTSKRLKENAKNKIEEKLEISIKSKTTNKLYQKLKEANITVFQYKDITHIVNWKYERIKKHILLLVKLNKIMSIGRHSGGKHAIFKINA